MKNIIVQLCTFITGCGILLLVSCGGDNTEEPKLQAPTLTGATDITSNSFSVDWDFVEGAEAYQVDLAIDASFSDFVAPYQESRQSFSEIRIADLEASTTYYFRVRSVFRDSFSQYSNTLEVTTLSENDSQPGTSLKNSAEFAVGMAVQVARLNGQHETILQDEFDQITSEYEMKMNIMYPSEGNYDFSRADATVDWAIANGLEVHGHALIWHNATPSWVENYSGTDAEFEALIEDYIKTTVTRYQGKVKSWDVVNEAFEDNIGTLRNSVFRQKMGDNYLEKCYQWAREADPDVLLFYNDYSMVIDPVKHRATINLVTDFIERGIPIDGVGYQMHISHDFPNKAAIESAAKEVTDLGLLLHFSELDVRANPNNDLQALSTQRAISQQTKVREVVEVYNAIPEASKFGITIWGMKDDETWLTDFWGHPDWPLLYNADFSPKRAHTGFLEGLQ
ncbi:MAG: endo-1,4-beta-xylanase [Cytophagales bacterium]|nr:endo-1,4-beta-xylanase [Cytophagales bacterium]